MDQVACAVKGESVLFEGSAESTYRRFALEKNRVVFQKMIGSARTRQTASNNNNFFHECISTFISRYADRTAIHMVLATAAMAHPSWMLLMRMAMKPRRSPTMYVVTV